MYLYFILTAVPQEAEGLLPDLERYRREPEPRLPRLRLPPPQRRRPRVRQTPRRPRKQEEVNSARRVKLTTMVVVLDFNCFNAPLSNWLFALSFIISINKSISPVT